MAAPVTSEFDDREFQRAINRYVELNGRDRIILVNNKAKDLMYRAAKKAPKGMLREIRALENNWRIRTWMGMKGGGKTRNERADISARIIRARIRSVGYMKSAFVKAGDSLKHIPLRVANPNQEKPPTGVRKIKRTRATVVKANRRIRPVVEYKLEWPSPPKTDGGKFAIANESMREARESVMADMMIYVRRKEEENARAVGLAVRRALT